MARGNYRSGVADNIHALMDSLPRLITQYVVSQNELEFKREQLNAQKQSNLFEAVLSNNSKKLELEERKVNAFEQNITDIEQEVSQITGALPEYGKDPNATIVGSNIGSKILEDFTGNQKSILEESYNNINDIVNQRGDAQAKFNFYNDIKHNLNDLANQSNKVHGNQEGSTGIADILDPQDFSAYFENILTGEEEGQYDTTDPMYGLYRRSFMNLAPSYEETTKNALTMYKLDETIKAQNKDKLASFDASSKVFIAGAVDSLYDVDDETGALTEISDSTKETPGWKTLIAEFRATHNFDPDQAANYINSAFIDLKRAYIQDPVQASDLMLMNPDMELIMQQLAPIQYSIFSNQFNELMLEGLVATRQPISNIPNSPTATSNQAPTSVGQGSSKATNLLNKINSGGI